MDLFLYLGDIEYAKPWIEGGSIPIFPASKYKSDIRSGVNTPDENLIHRSDVDLMSYAPAVVIEGGGVEGLTISGLSVSFGGGERQYLPDTFKADYYHDNGLILSFSHRLAKSVGRRFKNKVCAVRILDIDFLKSALDSQLGIVSRAGSCLYVGDHQRDHFKKSILDSWQSEYRLFWKLNPVVTWVDLPSGIAELACHGEN